MRSFGTSPDPEPTDYQRGYRMGIVHTVITGLVVGGGLVAFRWAFQTDVVQALLTWFTTPQISPANVLIVLFILVMAWMVSAVMTRFGGSLA